MVKKCKNGLLPAITTEVKVHSYMSVVEVSILLRMSTKTVYRLIRSGRMAAVKVSARITLIDAKELMDMLSQADTRETMVFPKEVKDVVPPVQEEDVQEDVDGGISVVTDFAVSEEDTGDDYYTIPEFCAKYRSNSANFYVFRQRYKIPCMDPKHPDRFSRSLCDKAMELDRLRKNEDIDRSQWYSCGELSELYGMNNSNIRRFALRNGVRTCRYQGCRLLYNKVDWDKARDKMNSVRKTEVKDCHSDDVLDCRDWYTSDQLSKEYGIQPKQVRRFANNNGVRMCRFKGKRMYNKTDWDAARQKSAASRKVREKKNRRTK